MSHSLESSYYFFSGVHISSAIDGGGILF